MISIETTEFAYVKRCLSPLDLDKKKAARQTQLYYLNVLIENHFKLNNPNGQYTPNTQKYEQWKKKHYGNLPQLVLSGALRKAVENGRVKSNGVIVFDLPDHGLYQIEAGRDFLKLWNSDVEELQKVYPQFLEGIRKTTISQTR